MLEVKIGKLPGRMDPYALEEGTTIQGALTTAGLNADGFEVRVNGTSVDDLNATLSDGDTVILSRKIKGN